MANVAFTLNGKPQTVDADPQTPLLWVIRDTIGLTGTKFGCGISQCGACTVHVDGAAQRSCVTPVSSVAGKKITTIEGLSKDRSHPLQQAWIAEQVPQCGYCQSGMLMTAAALLDQDAQAHRCRHRRRSGHPHLPLRHLQPHPQGRAPRRRRRPKGEGRCAVRPDIARYARFHGAAAKAAPSCFAPHEGAPPWPEPPRLPRVDRGRRRVRPELPLRLRGFCPGAAQGEEDPQPVRRLGAHRERRHRHPHPRQVGDGAGRHDRASHDPGRGARRGLGEGQGGAGPHEPRDLRPRHGRQRQREGLLYAAAPGGRRRTRDARGRGRRPTEGGGLRLQDGQGRGRRSHRPAPRLRRPRGRRGEAAAARLQDRRPEGRKHLPHRGDPGSARGRPVEGRRQRRLRHRRARARHALRRHRPLSHLRRQGGEVRRREGEGRGGGEARGGDPAHRLRRRLRAGRSGGGGEQHLGRHPGPRRPGHRVGPRSEQGRDAAPPSARRWRSWSPSPARSAATTATPRRRSPRPRRRSTRSTSCPSRPTPPWSRSTRPSTSRPTAPRPGCPPRGPSGPSGSSPRSRACLPRR